MMKGTTKKRYTLVSLAGQELFEFQILAIFALKSALKQAFNARFMFKSDKLGVVKCLTASPPLHALSGKKNRLGLNNGQNIRIYCKNILHFCKWKYSGESTWEAAYSLGSKGLQSLKVSNIWALPFDGFAM